MTGTPTTIRNFTEDMVTEVLSRLPVKSVFRFSSVCKLWLKLFTGKRFIKLHSHQSTRRNPNLFIRTHYTQTFQSLALDSDFPGGGPVNLNIDIQDALVIGSCNGLICLRGVVGKDASIHLLNPSTRERVEFPLPSINYYEERDTLGFGYDPVFDEYKLIRAVLNENGRSKKVMVYTLGKNIWRMIEGVPAIHFCNAGIFLGIHVNGILHWNGVEGSGNQRKNWIISFDLTSEKFGEIPWPNFGKNHYMITLGEWRGCLAVYQYYTEERVDIWLLKNYGVKESWTRMFSIGQPTPIGHKFSMLQPVVLMKDGDILMVMDAKNLLLYDPVKKTARIPVDLGFPEYFAAFPYVEAFTSIASLMAGPSIEEGGDMPKKP